MPVDKAKIIPGVYLHATRDYCDKVRRILAQVDPLRLGSHFIDRDWLEYQEQRKNMKWGIVRKATRRQLSRWANRITTVELNLRVHDAQHMGRTE